MLSLAKNLIDDDACEKPVPFSCLNTFFSSKIGRLTKPEETFEEIGLDLAGKD